MTAPSVLAAEANARQARERFSATLTTLQARLAPKALAQEAARTVIGKSRDLATAGLVSAKRHPAGVAGAVAAIGLFLARRPIARLLTRDGSDATAASPKSLTNDRPRAAARRNSQ